MDSGQFRLGTYEATEFIGVSFEEDSRGRFNGIYKEYFNKALDIILPVIGNYTFINKKFEDKLDHGFYNESIGEYTGSLGLLHRKEIDMIFPMLIPSHLISEGFAMTYSIEEGQLNLGTLTKTFKFKKIHLIYNLLAFDLFSWSFLIFTTLSIIILYTYINHFSYQVFGTKKKMFHSFFKKLIDTSIDYRQRTHYKTTFLLISLLMIRHIFVVIFPNCLSSNYIVLDKSNLVNSFSDLLDEKTIVLTTAMDGTTDFIRQVKRPYYDKLNEKIDRCGIYCLLETLNRHNFKILSNFADRKLSLISTKQIMTIMATTLCVLLSKHSLGNGETNEILFYKVPVENAKQTYSFAISSDISKQKLDQINLFSLKVMQNQILDALYTAMIDYYAPVVARIGPMFDAQNSDSMGSDISNNFTLTFAFFNSAFYTYIGLNLLVINSFILTKLYKKYFVGRSI